MAQIEVQLPSLLANVLDGQCSYSVEADTLRGALRLLRERHPRVAVHLFQEDGELRPHVLCFLNQTNSRWFGTCDVPLKTGDTLLIMQAVSGG